MPSAPWKAVVSIGIFLAALGIVFWWRAAGETPEVSAQDAVQNACNSLEVAKHYDVEAWATEYGVDPNNSFTIYVTMTVADSDFHQTFSAESRNDTEEFIRVDGVVYERRSRLGPEWKLSDRKLEGQPLSHLPVGSNPLCPEVSGFREVGKEILDGSEVKRYSEKPSEGVNVSIEDFDSKYHIQARFEDLLVDKDGQLLKIETEKYRTGIDGASGATVLVTTRQEMTISGIGEENVIEAPEVGTTGK